MLILKFFVCETFHLYFFSWLLFLLASSMFNNLFTLQPLAMLLIKFNLKGKIMQQDICLSLLTNFT